MSHYLTGVGSPRATPQSEPIPGAGQAPNSAGGHAWVVDEWSRLGRFLILGSEGGSYYASERALTRENAQAVADCLAADGSRTVRTIVAVSDSGRAPKNDPAIFALAMAAAAPDDDTRRHALDAIPAVCRTGTHLFQFLAFVEHNRGWGRGLRRAVARWYEDKTPDALASQVVKYRQRTGWTHDDVLRLAHPRPVSQEHAALFAWIAAAQSRARVGDIPKLVEGYELAQASPAPARTAELIAEYGLPRETVRTEHLTNAEVWAALLESMPMTAMIRNLATMTRVGLLTPTSQATRVIRERVVDADRLRAARVHPMTVLLAARAYAAGRSLRGSATWSPLPQVVDALDDAFYLAFGNVPATGQRRLLALDVSGSMWGGSVAGVPAFSPAEASAAMALVSMKTGDPYEVVAFTSSRHESEGAPPEVTPGLSVHPLSSEQRLDDVLRYTRGLARFMGGTDCALPMLYATQAGREFDLFEIYTDSETWAGDIHPTQALRRYREQSGIDAKLAVIAMVSNGFSIADPTDGGMLDVVGFDSATPELLGAFATGFDVATAA